MNLILRMPMVMTAFMLPMITGIAVVLPVNPFSENLPGITEHHNKKPENVTSIQKVVPVLPMPRYIDQYKAQPGLTSISSLSGNDLPRAIRERLWWHWQQFTNEYPTVKAAEKNKPVSIRLLGTDKAFDADVSQAAAQKLDQVGEEGYVLILRGTKRLLAARNEAGLFYGLQTLKQLIRAKWENEIVIVDWPSFAYRVIYDDISRGPISTVDYIKKQIERMAEIKINYLSFYIEHIVQPLSHPDFAPVNGKLTIPQIKELSAYASKFHMQLMGSFQSFGHFEKILALPQYASLGATSNLISPTNPQARKFLEDVIGELCDAFNSSYFNVNCDETFDLGQGTTKAYVDSMGESRFYANHLQFLYDIVKRHGKKTMMWGDFAVEHPEVLEMLPKDIMYLTWEYGDQASYDHWIKPFADRKLSYMVCPGILNSYRMFPDMVMARANIAGFAKAGQQQNAKGVITTIWDDGGTYLFSGDWYGVYVAAENSWTTDKTPAVSFDSRYEQTAYGTSNGNYIKALFKLQELRRQPLTYDLNDRLWQQKILPDSGKNLILNNTGADSVISIINEAAALLPSANPKTNKTDLHTLSFSINQYKLMVETRVKIASVVKDYKQALSLSPDSPRQAGILIDKDIKIIKNLAERYRKLQDEFKQAWLAENQGYWLDVTLAPYDKKIADLTQLSQNLSKVTELLAAHGSLPAASTVRLAVDVSSSFYFQNWMLTGPFPVVDKNKFPPFIYSDNPEYNKAPSPGDFTQYNGKLYRWRKFISADGGIIDLNVNYAQPTPAIAYAYCSITSGETTTIPAFISSNGVAEVFCNDQKVSGDNPIANNTGAATVNLPLKSGVNNIIIKLKKEDNPDWTFTFRLADNVNVTNHKHKYHLNAKTETHDAE